MKDWVDFTREVNSTNRLSSVTKYVLHNSEPPPCSWNIPTQQNPHDHFKAHEPLWPTIRFLGGHTGGAHVGLNSANKPFDLTYGLSSILYGVQPPGAHQVARYEHSTRAVLSCTLLLPVRALITIFTSLNLHSPHCKFQLSFLDLILTESAS